MRSNRIELFLPTSKVGIIPIDQDPETRRMKFEPQNPSLLRHSTPRCPHSFREGLTLCRIVQGFQKPALAGLITMAAPHRQCFFHQRVINALGRVTVS